MDFKHVFLINWPFLPPQAHTTIFTLISCIVYQNALARVYKLLHLITQTVKRYPYSYHNQILKSELWRVHLCPINVRSFVVCIHVSHSTGLSLFLRLLFKQKQLTFCFRLLSSSRIVPVYPRQLSFLWFSFICPCAWSITRGWRHAGGYEPQTIGMHRCTHPPAPFQPLSNERERYWCHRPRATQDYRCVLCCTLHFIYLSFSNQQVNMLVVSFIQWLYFIWYLSEG